MPNETLARRYATAVIGLAADGGKIGPDLLVCAEDHQHPSPS